MNIVNRLRGPIGIIAVWLLVVVVGSAMVWTVISRAGQNLLPASNPSFRATNPPTQEPAVESEPRPSRPQATWGPSKIRSKPAKSTPASNRAGPRDSTTSAPDSSPSPVAQPPTPEDPGADDGWDDGEWDGPGGSGDGEFDTTVRETWRGVGGLVVAECQGSAMVLIGAQADSGFHVAAWSGGDRVGAEFTELNGGTRVTEVFGDCRGGSPNFLARTEGGSPDGEKIAR